MARRYQDVYAELLEVVPELRPSPQVEEVSDAEYALKNSGQEYSEADLQYVREIEAKNPPAKKQEPLLTIIFESELWDLIVELAHEPAQHQRLSEIVAWLEDLANDADFNTSNLVGVTICEKIVISDTRFVELLFPLLGAKMRQMCVGCFSAFRVEDGVKRLFEKKVKP